MKLCVLLAKSPRFWYVEGGSCVGRSYCCTSDLGLEKWEGVETVPAASAAAQPMGQWKAAIDVRYGRSVRFRLRASV
jgi:hypothetical protein